MASSIQNPEQIRVLRTRKLLFFGGLIYLLWWAIVERVLPGSFNPLVSRLAVVSFFWIFFLASYRMPFLAHHLGLFFYGCACVATFHYFYLFHYNQSDINWVVGSYIIVIAVCACFESEKILLAYVVFVLICSLTISYLDSSLLQTVFLSGMLTILAFAYFGLKLRLRLMTEITSQAQMFEKLFDAVFEGMTVSHRGKILDANKSFSVLFGYSKSEVLKKSIADFVIPEDQDRVNQHWAQMSEETYEATALRKDGTRFPIAVYGKHHFWEGRVLRISSIRDLTEIKKSERNRVLLEASHEALKMSDEFIAIASHELRTPLTAIQLQIDIARLKITKNAVTPFLTEEVSALLNDFEHQVKRLTHLVEDMLYSSTLTMGNFTISPQRLQLPLLVTSVLANMTSAFKQSQMSPVLESDPSLEIEADPKRIEQVLLNLFSNTVKYAKGKQVTVSVKKIGDTAVIQVQDGGMGIAIEDQERIFRKFERAVPAKKITGMGLGLFICKKIIEAHHGQIEVSSDLGKGTRFTVVLPLVRRDGKRRNKSHA